MWPTPDSSRASGCAWPTTSSHAASVGRKTDDAPESSNAIAQREIPETIMTAKARIALAAMILSTLPCLAADAPSTSACDDGFTVIEETCYREVVVRSWCRLV